MAVTGDNWCRYQPTASEQYQNPGLGSHCGAETFQGFEEYEDVTTVDGKPRIEKKTRLRDQYDPHCPEHGGTEDPRKNDDKESVEESSSNAAPAFEGSSSSAAPAFEGSSDPSEV